MFGLYISVDGADALGLALGDRGVYEHLLGLNVSLAVAKGLRSASAASAEADHERRQGSVQFQMFHLRIWLVSVVAPQER